MTTDPHQAQDAEWERIRARISAISQEIAGMVRSVKFARNQARCIKLNRELGEAWMAAKENKSE